MATGNSVNDEIREQAGRLKGKTPKEKLSWFWDYYKVPTLVTVLIIFLLGNFIYTLATRKDSALEAVFLNTWLKEEVNSEQMAADFIDWAGIDAKEYQAFMNTNMFIDYEGMDQYSAANIQKVMAMVSSRTLDVIVTDDAYLEANKDSGMFGDLTEYLSDSLLEKYGDRLIYADISEDGKGEVPIAVDVRDSGYFLSDQVPAWFCIVSNTQNGPAAVQFLDYLLEP